MWNLTCRIAVTLLIASTLASQASSHSHMRFRSASGAGVRGRRDGEVGTGGYGRSSAPAPPALYSAPKLTTFESVRIEPASMNPTPAPATDDVESLEQQATTTELASDTGAEEIPTLDQDVMEDSTMESATQIAEATESSSVAVSSAENEVSVDGIGREGTTEAAATEQPSGRYLIPNQQGGRQRDSFAENSIATSGGYYKPSQGGVGGYQNQQHYDSSAAFSTYYSAQRTSRPIDQQQVENFNYQQYTDQQQSSGRQLPSSQSQSQDQVSTAGFGVAGGYGGQVIQMKQQKPQPAEPSYEQITAIGYQQPQPQQQQQQYAPQPQPQPQPQAQFRYIAQQPEQFYPTPAVGPVQQYLPINPLIEGRQQQQQQPYVVNNGAATYSYPDPPPPAHIQSNIAEVVQQQNIAEPQPPQYQQQTDGGHLVSSVTQADYSSQADNFGNAINVDSDEDSMDVTFEGLNDNVVDAELLERVQQIIEEHERQQKDFLQQQRESGQGQGVYNSPVQQEVVGPNGLILESPRPSIHYEVDTRNGNGNGGQPQPSYISNEITPRGSGGGYGFGNGAQTSQSPLRFSQQLQQHQAFNGNGNGNGNGGSGRGQSGRALQGKKIANLDVQPAILTQHFMESGTPSNLQRQTFSPQRQQQQQAYLPPRQEYSNTEQRPQAASVSASSPVYQDTNQYQYQQQQQQQEQQVPQNGYQQSQPQNQYITQQQPQIQQQVQVAYSGGYPQEQQHQFQPSQGVVGSFNSGAVGYSSPSQFQQQQQTAAQEPSQITYEQQPQQNDETKRGGFTQQFRQEYSRPAPQPQTQAYPSYQYTGNTNSIESDSDESSGGYEAPPRPNIITKTIVIHEQPAPTYNGQYPAGISNRAIITADDLRGTGLGGITISMQRPQAAESNYANDDSGSAQQEQQPQLQQYVTAIPQYQYLSAMSQFAIGSEQQQQPQPQTPSMIYLPMPVYQQPEPRSQQEQEPIRVSMPKPVYGIPLAPALGPESIASLPPSTYGNPQYRQQPQQQQQQYSPTISNSQGDRLTYIPPQYSNAVDMDSDQNQSHDQGQGQSLPLQQDSAVQQSIWDSTLHAVYRLPNTQSDGRAAAEVPAQPQPSDSLSLTNPIPLVSQVVTLPNSNTDSSSQTQSESSSSNGGYGERIASASSRRSVRRSFSHAYAAPVAGHRLVSVRSHSLSS